MKSKWSGWWIESAQNCRRPRNIQSFVWTNKIRYFYIRAWPSTKCFSFPWSCTYSIINNNAIIIRLGKWKWKNNQLFFCDDKNGPSLEIFWHNTILLKNKKNNLHYMTCTQMTLNRGWPCIGGNVFCARLPLMPKKRDRSPSLPLRRLRRALGDLDLTHALPYKYDNKRQANDNPFELLRQIYHCMACLLRPPSGSVNLRRFT